MNKVDFTYNDDKYFVQCNNDDKMKDIIDKFLNKAGKNRRNIVFLYNGLILNEELIFSKCANSLDRSRNCMNVLVLEGQGANDEINLIKSKYIICPECYGNAYITIDDFKISIICCKSAHKTEYLQLNEFNKTQNIDQSKIKCDKCNELKSRTEDNKFYICNKCKLNLCPDCKNRHDESHKEFIKDYEENQFYCKIHFKEYTHYCSDCNKDICSLCEEEHENHKLISFDNIIKDIDLIKNHDIKDTKDKIVELKSIVSGMFNILNKLNKNLDTYFEIFDNIISNFDTKKRNYSLIQSFNNIRQYNNNFLGNVTEIIKDDNLKTQFIGIINLEKKIDFKELKNKNQIEKAEQSETNIDKNEIIIDENIIEDNSDTNLKTYNFLDYKYENFSINNMKELQSFTTKNEVSILFILNDGRMLTNQNYSNEDGDTFYKLCVYSIENKFICDINIDYDFINEIDQMNDGNVIQRTKYQNIKVIKIKKNNIEEIWNFEANSDYMKRLSDDLIYIEAKKRERDAGFFGTISFYEEEIYSYNNGQLTFYKNIHNLKKEKGMENMCLINKNEIAFYAKQKGKIYGTNEFLYFYDIQNNKKLKKFKVGNGQNIHEMRLINKDSLIFSRDESVILFDVKNRKILNEFKFELNIRKIILLSENKFLCNDEPLCLYELVDSKTIQLKEEREIECFIISKYYGNKLIIYDNKKFIIFG